MNIQPSENQSLSSPENLPQYWQEEVSDTFVPTAVQLDRADALKRFNRRVVYIPLGLLAAAAIGLIIYLLVIAIRPPSEDTRIFLSGLADIVLILFLLPGALILGLLLAGLFGGMIYWRKSQNEADRPPLAKKYGRLRLLLWKGDQRISAIYRQLEAFMPRLANPIIRLNAFLAYLNAWLTKLSHRFYRHNAE